MFKASEIMKLPVMKVTPETSVADAVDLMLKQNISGVPVVDNDGQLVGMFSETDQFCCDISSSSDGRVMDHMTTDVTSLDVDAPIIDVVNAFKNTRAHRMAVTRGGTVVGVIGCRDLAKFLRKVEKEFGALSQLVACQEKPEPWCNID